MSQAECPFVKGQIAQLPGGDVNYLLQGPPAPAPLVVCIHGINGSIGSFSSLEPRLRARGLRVLLYDLYGFGLSAASRGRLDHHTYVQQLQGLLDFLGIANASLLGFSMGGIVAIEFAKCNPERVTRLLLAAPGGLLQRAETPCAPILFGCLRTRCGCVLVNLASCIACCCRYPIRRAARKGRLDGTFQLDVREPEHFSDVSHENMLRFAWNPRRSLTSYLRALRSMPLWSNDFRSGFESLATSNVPVLFLWGSSDSTIPWWEIREELLDILGDSEVSCIHLSRAGHHMLIEDAEQAAVYISAWFMNSKDPSWHQLLQSWRLKELAAQLAARKRQESQASPVRPTPAVLGTST